MNTTWPNTNAIAVACRAKQRRSGWPSAAFVLLARMISANVTSVVLLYVACVMA